MICYENKFVKNNQTISNKFVNIQFASSQLLIIFLLGIYSVIIVLFVTHDMISSKLQKQNKDI